LHEEPERHSLSCPDVVLIDVDALDARSRSPPVRNRPLPPGHGALEEILRAGSRTRPFNARQLGSARAEGLARLAAVTAVQGITVRLCAPFTPRQILLQHAERVLAGATSHAQYKWGVCSCPLRQFTQERSEGYEGMVVLWCSTDSVAIHDIEDTLIRRHTYAGQSSSSHARCNNVRPRPYGRGPNRNSPPGFCILFCFALLMPLHFLISFALQPIWLKGVCFLVV